MVASGDGKTRDILKVYCQPGPSREKEGESIVCYDRFHFDGTQWVRYEKREKGFWEVKGDNFPALSKFPPAGKEK